MIQHDNSNRRPYRPYSRNGLLPLALVPDRVESFVLDPMQFIKSSVSNTTFQGGTFSSDGVTLRNNLDGASTPRFSYGPTGLPNGILFEPLNTNLLFNAHNFGTSGKTNNWVQSNMTGAGTVNATGPDGTTSAVTLTASASGATISQSRGAVGVGTRVFSVWLRRVGNWVGNVDIAYNTSGTWVTMDVEATWKRFYVTATSGAAVPGIKINTSGGVIEAFGPQLMVTAKDKPYSTSFGTDSGAGHGGDILVIPHGDSLSPNYPLASLDEFTVIGKIRTPIRERAAYTGSGGGGTDIKDFVGIFEIVAEGGDFLVSTTMSSGSGTLYAEGYLEDVPNSVTAGPEVFDFGIAPPDEILFGISLKAGTMLFYVQGTEVIAVNDAFPFDRSRYSDIAFAVSTGALYLQSIAVWPWAMNATQLQLRTTP